MFSVRYIYSACLVVQTDDLRLLCDPWFTDGIYDGSWYQFPPTDSPNEKIGPVDAIYISHIHPDHYDPRFISQYFDEFGEVPILIPRLPTDFLKRKMNSDGFSPQSVDTCTFGNTQIQIFPNLSNSLSDIDSALVVNAGDKSFLNLNDNQFNPEQNSSIHKSLRELILAAIGYTGAGPYPQTYFDLDDKVRLLDEAAKKKLKFLGRFKQYIDEFNPRAVIPFAGKYLLGSRLAPLNDFRGVADAVETLAVDERVIVPEDDFKSGYDLERQSPFGRLRTTPYDTERIRARISEISRKQLDYELQIAVAESAIPFERLIKAAYLRASSRSECLDSYYVFLGTGTSDKGWLLQAQKGHPSFKRTSLSEAVNEAASAGSTISTITVDYRYLYGLLTGIYHWNNAEVGSHLIVRRFPDTHNPSAQDFLNFLSVV